jgi:chromosome segregation ATPase
MITDELKKEAEDDVIPLEITGSVKVYNQAYVDKQEKRIAELEQEIKVLTQNLEDTEICEQALKDKVAKLKKENAELKEQNETKDIQIKELQEQKCYWKESSFDWRHKFFKKDEVKRLVKKDKQLTKAKNLLQKVADVCGYPNYDIPVELYADIADFLKESEVGK